MMEPNTKQMAVTFPEIIFEGHLSHFGGNEVSSKQDRPLQFGKQFKSNQSIHQRKFQR